MELEKTYDHKKVEDKIYQRWMESGYFDPDKLPNSKQRKPYTIIMPPPNANAPSHVGHALGYTIQDILIRYHRMRGRKALWLPGSDHAGFETQVVFEKKLEKEGRSRFKMQRDEFYKEIWDYVQQNKHISEEAIRRLGASCDWSRNIFTLDPEIVKVVYQTFKQMHDDGLIYRGDRIGNWCSKHQTALSDLETKYEEREEPFYYFKYGPFTIGTSRPETKFGDKYVVMHPQDKRYAQYKNGETFTAEWINGPVRATIIKDEIVDMNFGSGVMTVTPWHDPVDFEIAQRHNLDKEQIIDKFGKLLPIAGEFAGMKIAAARPLIVEKLKSKGLLEKVDEKYKHNVQVCYKCGTVIEPQIIPQWFVAMTKPLPDGRSSLRDMAVSAIKNGEVKIVTERFEKIFMHWMDNLRDWPISRQIWWGIPIPVWYCKRTLPVMGFAGDIVTQVFDKKTLTYRLRDHGFKAGDTVAFEDSSTKQLFGYGIITEVIKTAVGNIDLQDNRHWKTYGKRGELIQAFQRHHPDKEIDNDTPAWLYVYEFHKDIPTGCGKMLITDQAPLACPVCGNKNLLRDPDTFDTWFSSGQWPYATMMANDAKHGTSTFADYYPTQVMETAWDILFFWVARMIMFSYYRTGKPPFEKVFLHGLVRDKDRQKMSKSKGNVIDPLGVIDTYGTDALRFALIFSTAAGNDIPLSEDKIKGMKHFANKLWNIARFIMTNIENAELGIRNYESLQAKTAADTEVLDALKFAMEEVTEGLENFQLHAAAQEIYQFVWHSFADIYIEASKKQLADPELKANTQAILLNSLFKILKLLHPFMPFITEHIWQLLKEQGLVKTELLMIAEWPK